MYGIPPTIIDFSPTLGPIGTKVTVTGKNFNPTKEKNTVFFGSVPALVLSATSTSLEVAVPKGAPYQPIRVYNNNLIAYSKNSFSITFPGSQPTFSSASFGEKTNFKDLGVRGRFADLDGNGLTDVVTVGPKNNIIISANTSNSSRFEMNSALDIYLGYSPVSFCLSDVDGDGKHDIIVNHEVLINTSSIGNFSFTKRYKISNGLSGSITVKDLDMDGKPEIIMSGYSSNIIAIFKNQSLPGFPLFVERIDYGSGLIEDVKAEDIDGDGKPELLAAVNGANAVAVFQNNCVPGLISFGTRKDFLTGQWPKSIATGDLNGDNKIDIVSADENNVAILINTSSSGVISFSKNDIPLIQPWSAWISDIDGDGKPDLGVHVENRISINSSDMSLLLFKNLGSEGSILFGKPYEIKAGLSIRESFSADMDNDGKPEVILYQEGLTILKNNVGGNPIISVCENSKMTIPSNLNASTYQWQQNNGNGFFDIIDNADFKGTNTAILEINNAKISWNGYQFRCISNNDSSITTILAVNQIPIANAGKDTSLCLGGVGVNIGMNALEDNTYSWSPTNGLVSPISARTIANPNSTTTYNLTVTNIFGCKNEDSIVISINRPDQPVITAQGPYTFCKGGNVELTSSSTTNNQWYRNDVSIPGANNQSYLAQESGQYSVRIFNGSCLSLESNTILVMVKKLPEELNILTPESNTICKGDSALLKISTVDSTGIQWYRDGGLLAGVSGLQYFASLTGSYSVTKSVNGCKSKSSNVVLIDVNESAKTPVVTALGVTSFCEGDSVLLKSSNEVGNQWYNDGIAISGAVSPFFTSTKGGSYAVRTTVNDCTSDLSNPTIVSINPVPVTPEISKNGYELFSSSNTGNQWYLNGVAISGATSQTHTAITSGVYTVRVTQGKCSSNYSKGIEVVVTLGVLLGPNPVSDQLFLQYPDNTTLLSFILLDVNGQAVLERGTFIGSHSINMGKYKPGNYILQLINNQTKVKEQKIIVKL